ncbi:MAG TPA: hypothetical protein VGE21_00870 [Flavobacteriales bacterium]
MHPPSHLKRLIHGHCVAVLQERIQAAQEAAASIQDSARSDTKSSAGDKHETARAMAQIELEKQQLVLRHLSLMKATLDGMDPDEHHEAVEPGALISTDLGAFYIATSLGKVVVEGVPIWVISPQAPLFQVLKDTPVGEIAFFNGQAYRMQEVA